MPKTLFLSYKSFWVSCYFKKISTENGDRKLLSLKVSQKHPNSIMRWKREVFVSSAVLLRQWQVFTDYNINIQMSQGKQVQMSQPSISINQKANSSLNSSQPGRAINLPSFSAIFQQQAAFMTRDGQKPKPRNSKWVQFYQEWTDQDENLLFQLHNRKGNKWVEIARQLKRNENAVKNHYHSKLRKAMRKLNRCISERLRRQFRPLKNNLISKIILTAEDLYLKKPEEQNQNTVRAYELKNKLLSFSQFNQQQVSIFQLARIKKIVSELLSFEDDLKAIQKNEAKAKGVVFKYKGKEILGLINQNIKAFQTQPISPRHPCPLSADNLELSVSAREVESEKQEQQEQQQEEGQEQQAQEEMQRQQKREEEKEEKEIEFQSLMPSNFSAEHEMSSGVGVYSNYPTILYLNEGMYSYQPVYYTMYQQSSNDIFSGRMSSFSSFHPQLQSLTETGAQLMSLTRIEQTHRVSRQPIKKFPSIQMSNFPY